MALERLDKTWLGGLVKKFIVLPNSTMCEVCERFKVDDPEYIRLTKGHRFAVACICAKKQEERDRADRRRIDEANIPNDHDPHTFEAWNHGADGTAEMFGAAHRFARGEGHRVLVLCGGTGAGKSYLLEAIGRYSLGMGRSVRYETSKALLDQLQATYNPETPGTFQNLMDWYQTRSVLLLDDVGAETSTEWRISQLTDIIEQRIQYNRSLVVTTNLNRTEMIDRLGARIGSRLFATNPNVPVTLVVTTAKDYRR